MCNPDQIPTQCWKESTRCGRKKWTRYSYSQDPNRDFFAIASLEHEIEARSWLTPSRKKDRAECADSELALAGHQFPQAEGSAVKSRLAGGWEFSSGNKVFFRLGGNIACASHQDKRDPPWLPSTNQVGSAFERERNGCFFLLKKDYLAKYYLRKEFCWRLTSFAC